MPVSTKRKTISKKSPVKKTSSKKVSSAKKASSKKASPVKKIAGVSITKKRMEFAKLLAKIVGGTAVGLGAAYGVHRAGLKWSAKYRSLSTSNKTKIDEALKYVKSTRTVAAFSYAVSKVMAVAKWPYNKAKALVVSKTGQTPGTGNETKSATPTEQNQANEELNAIKTNEQNMNDTDNAWEGYGG